VSLFDEIPDGLAAPEHTLFVENAQAAVGIGMAVDGNDPAMILLRLQAAPLNGGEKTEILFAMPHEGALRIAEMLLTQTRRLREAMQGATQ
jgi:hypothetical protein